MDPALIREFTARRWDLVSERKRRVRVERYEAGGALACLEVLADLRARFLRAQPGGDSDASRRKDIAHHQQLASKFRQVHDGCTTRRLAAALVEAGFSLLVDDAAPFVEQTRVLPLVHTPTSIPVDVVAPSQVLVREHPRVVLRVSV